MAFRTSGCLPPRTPIEGVELARGRVDDIVELLDGAIRRAPPSELRLYAVAVVSRFHEMLEAEAVVYRAEHPHYKQRDKTDVSLSVIPAQVG